MTTYMTSTWPTLPRSGAVAASSVRGSWTWRRPPLLKIPPSHFSGRVSDSGEGRWTIMAAIDEAVEVDVLSAALFARFRSRKDHTMAEKVCSAMRFQFGGHLERAAGG